MSSLTPIKKIYPGKSLILNSQEFLISFSFRLILNNFNHLVTGLFYIENFIQLTHLHVADAESFLWYLHQVMAQGKGCRTVFGILFHRGY